MGVSPGGSPPGSVPGGGMTLDALIARQKQLSNQQIELPQMTSPMQGVGYLAQSVMQGLSQGRADKQLAEGRQALSQAMTQFNPDTGEFSPEAMQVMGALMPEKVLPMLHDMAESRRQERQAAAQREFQTSEREAGQTFQHGEGEATRAQQAADAAAQRAQQTNLQEDRQEAERLAAIAKVEADKEAASTAAKTEAAKPQTDTARIEADFQAGRISQAERDDALKKANYVAPAKPGDLFTPGQAAYDTQAAKEILDWNQAGGGAAAKAVEQVQKALDLLNANPSKYTGITGAAGLIPDALKPYLNPNGQIAQDAIRETVQTTLRQVLGSQFTQQEGEALMNRAFNDRLDPTENARRAGMLMEQVKQIAVAKQAMAEHWAKWGTLSNYAGPVANARAVLDWDPDKTSSTGGGGGGDILQEARDALARGADRAAVEKRLREQGGDPSKL